MTSIAAYDANARAYQEALRRRRPMQDARRFAALAAPGARVLDAGCGPANDIRMLRDLGLQPIGVDLAVGALREARLLLPKQGLVVAPYTRLPFRTRCFGGLWLSGSFTHLPREEWRDSFKTLLEFLERGPVYFACVRGTGDLVEVDDPILGRIYRSEATEQEVEGLLTSHGLEHVRVDLRPDPVVERGKSWIAAVGIRS